MPEAPLTLMLVEDDVQDALLFQTVLRELAPDVRLVHVPDAAGVFRQLGHWEAGLPPLLILLDLNLGGPHGYEVLEQLKTRSASKHLPVLVFSGSDEQTDIDRSYRLHANAYLVKPQSMDAYRTLVRVVLRYWRDATQLPARTAP